MKTADFIARVTEIARAHLPPEWQGCVARQWGHQVQLHYGVPRLH